MAGTIIGGTVAAKALGWCRSQRVVVTGVWNSNGLKNGFGLIDAIQQSLVAQGIKIFAAGPTTLTCTNGTTDADDGNTSPRSNNSCVGWQRVVTSSGANTLLDPTNVLSLSTLEQQTYKFGRGNDGSGTEYPGLYRMLHFKNNAAVSFSGAASGISFSATAASPFHIDPTAALRTDHWYSNATAAGGTFRPVAINGSVPNVHVANYGSAITVPAGTATAFSRATWDVPAGARDTQLRVGPTAGIASPADMRPTGEVAFGYQVTWERDALAGVLVAPFIAMGGWSTRDMAHNLSRVDGSQCYTAAIDHWIQVCVRPIVDASQTPRMIFFINEGSNEANETLTSIPNGYAGGTTNAYVDNVASIIAVWRARWAALGYAADDFVVVVCPDHPNATSGETARSDFAATGMPFLVASEPTRTFGIDSLGKWSTTTLKNLGVGLETLYDRAPNTPTPPQTITAIATATAGANISVTMPNAFTTSDLTWVTGSNCTPNINGSWAITSVTGTGAVLTNPSGAFAVTGAGTAGSARKVDTLHLCSSGSNGATTHGYRTYWASLAAEWAAAGSRSVVGVGISMGIGLGSSCGGGGGGGAGA